MTCRFNKFSLHLKVIYILSDNFFNYVNSINNLSVKNILIADYDSRHLIFVKQTVCQIKNLVYFHGFNFGNGIFNGFKLIKINKRLSDSVHPVCRAFQTHQQISFQRFFCFFQFRRADFFLFDFLNVVMFLCDWFLLVFFVFFFFFFVFFFFFSIRRRHTSFLPV